MSNSIDLNKHGVQAYENLSALIHDENIIESEKEREKIFAKNHSNVKFPLFEPFDIKDHIKSIYRSRVAQDIKPHETITNARTFSYVPDELLSDTFPRRGRLNLTGQSMLYASFARKTNFREILEDIKENDFVFQACYRKKDAEEINCYPVVNWENKNTNHSPFDKYIETLSHILLDPRSKYLASSFLANFILYGSNSRKYDAILYPSVKAVKSLSDLNIAIKPNYFKQHFELDHVIYGHVNSSLTEGKAKYVGFSDGTGVVWYEFKTYPKGNIIYELEKSNGEKTTIEKEYSDDVFQKYLLNKTDSNSDFELMFINKITEREKMVSCQLTPPFNSLEIRGNVFIPENVIIRCLCTLKLEKINNPDETILGHKLDSKQST